MLASVGGQFGLGGSGSDDKKKNDENEDGPSLANLAGSFLVQKFNDANQPDDRRDANRDDRNIGKFASSLLGSGGGSKNTDDYDGKHDSSRADSRNESKPAGEGSVYDSVVSGVKDKLSFGGDTNKAERDVDGGSYNNNRTDESDDYGTRQSQRSYADDNNDDRDSSRDGNAERYSSVHKHDAYDGAWSSDKNSDTDRRDFSGESKFGSTGERPDDYSESANAERDDYGHGKDTSYKYD